MNYPWLEEAETAFAKRLETGRLAHALLLEGPARTGKDELAARIMAGVLCIEGVYPACGKCRSCQLLATGAHPDGHVVTFEENPNTGKMRTELLVHQVRRLTASLSLTNTISPRKAALIHPVEAMNIHAANALLKTLEEPPGDAVILLLSHDPARLPATIRSRCQKLSVRLPSKAAAQQWLAERSDVPPERAALALEAAAGSPLSALDLLDDGGVDAFAAIHNMLDAVLRGSLAPAEAPTAVEDIDPVRLWSWISLRAARATRAAVTGRRSAARALSELQREADRNRRLASTPVREDLLLQDWLIQWSRLNR